MQSFCTLQRSNLYRSVQWRTEGPNSFIACVHSGAVFYFLPLELWFRKLIVSSLPASLQSFLLFSFPLFLALLLPVLLGSPPSSPSGHPHNIALQAFLSQHLRKLKLLGLDHEIWLLLSKHSFKMGLPRKTAPGP